MIGFGFSNKHSGLGKVTILEKSRGAQGKWKCRLRGLTGFNLDITVRLGKNDSQEGVAVRDCCWMDQVEESNTTPHPLAWAAETNY